MRLMFIKFPQKKESRSPVSSSSINDAGRSKVQYGRDIRTGVRLTPTSEISCKQQKSRRRGSLEEKHNVIKPEFTIVGCRIVNDDSALGEHDFKAIQQRIEAVYSKDIEWMIQNIKSYDKTIIADLLLGHLGIVVENRFVYPAKPKHTSFYKKTHDRILKWVFPQILHQGRCRLAFSGKRRNWRTLFFLQCLVSSRIRDKNGTATSAIFFISDYALECELYV